MDISDALDIIDDTLTEYFDTRMYNFYLECVDKEQCNSYSKYKASCIKEVKVENEVIDIEERKRQAEATLKGFIEGGM